MKELSIIIVNFNTPELVYDCIASIQEWLSVSYQIIVVDNGSTTKLEPSRLPKECTYLELPENCGFGAGNNAGAKQATGKYLWLLNSDTVLVDKSTVHLVRFLDGHPEVGIVSPYLFNNGHLQPDFYASFQSFKTLLLRNARPALETKAKYQPVDLVVGAALMIRRTLFEQLGGFDENFFMYLEDDDLCLRAKQAGYSTVLLPSANIIHLQGQSIDQSASRKNYYYRSQDYFWRKHYGRMAAKVMGLLRLPYRLLRNGR